MNSSPDRTTQLLSESLDAIRRWCDRLFGTLFIVEWVAGVACAALLSPRAWTGATSTIHVHLWAAALLGGIIVAPPLWLISAHPGATATRHVVAVSQMLYSALLIHLTGGRLETHFHIFGSLAFLSFYLDRRVLLTATAVTVVDHCLRGLFWPESIYGVLTGGEWRWLEHAGWVAFCDLFLLMSCRRGILDKRLAAQRQAHLESLQETLETRDSERTSALYQSEKRFRVLTTCATVGIFQADELGKVVFVNDRYCALTGLSSDEAVGRAWERCIHPNDRSAAVAGWNDAVAARKSFAAESRILRSDGGVAWVSIKSEFLDSADGESHGILGTVYDITESKQHEQYVYEINERLTNAFANAPIGMALVTPTGQWLQVNRALCHILRCDSDDLVGQDYWTWVHPDDAPEVIRKMSLLLDGTSGGCRYELRIRRSDGPFVSVLFHLSLVRDQSGGPLYYVAQIQDLSEHKKIESQRDLFFDQSATPLVITDLTGHVRRVNEAYATLFGHRTTDLKNCEVAQFVHPADRLTFSTKNATAGGRRRTRFVRSADADQGGELPLDVVERRAPRR